MTDGIQKGSGNAYALQTVANAASLYPTYEQFIQAFATGQLFTDLKLNPEGWDPLGTSLNKANLLKDATAALYGLGKDAVLDDILAKPLAQIEIGSYAGTGKAVTASNPMRLTFTLSPKIIFIFRLNQTNAIGSIFSRYALYSDNFQIFLKSQYGIRVYDEPGASYDTYNKTNFEDHAVSWYNSSGYENLAMNQGNLNYGYIAIG